MGNHHIGKQRDKNTIQLRLLYAAASRLTAEKERAAAIAEVVATEQPLKSELAGIETQIGH